MKKTLKLFVFGSIIMAALASCSKFLDKFPDSREDITIDDKKKIGELLGAAYPRSSYFRFCELRTDNVGLRQGNYPYEHSRLNEAMYYWRGYNEEDLDSPVNYWNDCYRGIAHANKALELLRSYPDKEDPQVKALYGEAFLLRAYLHFMLVNIWGEPYLGKEESRNLKGIPYVDRPEKNAWVEYPRQSVTEVYEAIEKDLLLGLSLVDERYYKHPEYRFNKKAAYAFASRFFLYTGSFQQAIDYASWVLGARPSERIYQKPLGTVLREMTHEERIKQAQSPKAVNNLMTVTTESLWADSYKEDKYGLNERTYGIAIRREDSKVLVQIDGYVEGVVSTRDPIYYPKFSSFTDEEGLRNPKRGHYTENALFRTEEVLLNRAEAYAALGKTELALGDMDVLIKNRFDPGMSYSFLDQLKLTSEKEYSRVQPFYRPLTPEQASLIYVISELRREEFMHEGLRWFDLRRFRMSVDRNLPGGEQVIAWRLQPEDKRKTLELPEAAQLSGID